MTAKNAIDWHTQIAKKFDKKYSMSNDFKERYGVWIKIIDKYSNKNYHSLDIGCGSGVFTFYLAEKNKTVLGIDASIEMLNICAEKMKSTDKKNISFINCNIDLLEDNIDKKADVIVCSSVLEYLDNLDESLTMIMKSMNNNGVFIFSMPNKQSFYRRIEPVSFSLVGFPKYYKHVRNICTPTEMRERLERIGFSIVESEYYAKTPFLSKIFRKIGMPYYADNLFIMVAKLSP